MSLTLLDQLKINLNEIQDSTMTDEQLNNLLVMSNNNLSLASYKGCLLKAAPEKKIKVGGIEVTNFDTDYWMQLAAMYKEEYDRSLENSSGGYITHLTREDEYRYAQSSKNHLYY